MLRVLGGSLRVPGPTNVSREARKAAKGAKVDSRDILLGVPGTEIVLINLF